MKISGFSFVRNGIKLYYPIVEAIKSALPICDEFVIAVGQGDKDDDTREQIAKINDPKIKIIDTEWDSKFFKKGIINSLQTDIAKNECCGDWLLYLQADEVIHEKYLPVIKERCQQLLSKTDVEALLFSYKHFWGDYNHYHSGHGWYPYEIRIIRNIPQIRSYQSAQSFRWFDFYDNPRQETGTRKLKVARVDAEIYHYGWVRPPELMRNKSKSLDTVHWGKERAEEHYQKLPPYFDYGPLDRLAIFKEAHPEVMQDIIRKMDWQERLQYSGKPNPYRKLHKHEQFRYRLISLFEKWLNGGKQIGTFKNYELLKSI